MARNQAGSKGDDRAVRTGRFGQAEAMALGVGPDGGQAFVESDVGSRLLKATHEDPFGDASKGAFFGRTPLGSRAKAGPMLGVADDYAYFTRVRHLPTDVTVDGVVAFFGDPARGIMGEWRALWDAMTGGRLASVAETFGYGVPTETVALGWTLRTATSETLRSLSERRCDDRDVARLLEIERQRHGPAARPKEMHALEDAVVSLSLARAKVPVAFGLFPCASTPFPMHVARADRAEVVQAASLAGWRALEDLQVTPAYWDAPAFVEGCGRVLQPAYDHNHASVVLWDMARLGHAKAFVKQFEAKAGTWVVDLSGIESLDDAYVALARGMGAAVSASSRGIVASSGGGYHLLVQEFQPPVFEHRFFVVRGRVVASTPSDRSLSVLDARPGPGRLDPRVARLAIPASKAGAYDRGDTSSEVNRPLVAAMARIVRRLAAAARNDAVSTRLLGEAYVVDVGSDGPDPTTATVDLIEVNSFRNAGLYAVRYDLVADAIARALAGNGTTAGGTSLKGHDARDPSIVWRDTCAEAPIVDDWFHAVEASPAVPTA